MKGRKNRRLFQFKVTLRGIPPPIWRQIQTWEDHTLAQLHRVLQVAMGWENYHLCEFRIGTELFGPADPEFGRKSARLARNTATGRKALKFDYVRAGRFCGLDKVLDIVE